MFNLPPTQSVGATQHNQPEISGPLLTQEAALTHACHSVSQEAKQAGAHSH